MDKTLNKNIKIYGTSMDIRIAESKIKETELTGDESKDRVILQAVIDLHKLKARILYNGNSVWSRNAVIRDLKKILTSGSTEKSLTDYLYDFFNLQCGTIAHFNKQGWASMYPDTDSIRRLFIKNEYGNRVLEHIPRWQSDVILIVSEIEGLLGIFGKKYRIVRTPVQVVRTEIQERLEEVA